MPSTGDVSVICPPIYSFVLLSVQYRRALKPLYFVVDSVNMNRHVADASSSLALASAAVQRAIASRASGAPDQEWKSFLEADFTPLAERDLTLRQILTTLGWHEGVFSATPKLEDLRAALPVFSRRSSACSGADVHTEFERCATRFINKATPRSAHQAAQEFCASGMWSTGDERLWRLQAFSSLWLRAAARVARLRPARGNLFRPARSILNAQVAAISELLLRTNGLRTAIESWIIKLLGCQQLWQKPRRTILLFHHMLAKESRGIGELPHTLMRRVMGFVFPEPDPVQSTVACTTPPHATDTEAAIVFGHLLWSSPAEIWRDLCPAGVLVVDTLLTTSQDSAVHHAGIILFALCGRLEREPLHEFNLMACNLGRRLKDLAGNCKLTGFMRHRVDSAVEASCHLCVESVFPFA